MESVVEKSVKMPRELVQKIAQLSEASGNSFSEILRQGARRMVDENPTDGLANRVEKLEKNVFALVESLKAFAEATNRNFEVARETEKVRLQAIVDLIKTKVDGHENEDKERMKLLVEWIEKLAVASNGRPNDSLSF